ncbi:MAG: tetratricopeptide repeat protein, partial [Deltaproteobacteria bacterium]|nr:tetratricopeptide repeat protein [Deltaproteobacteria bacterium]
MGIFDRIGQKLGDLVEDLSVDPEVGDLLTDARRAYEGGDYQGAATLAERVTRAEETHVRAWTLLGLSHLRQEHLTEARGAFERTLTLRPDDPSTMALLARTQFRLGNMTVAMTTAKRALAGKVDRDLLDDFYGLLGEIFLHQDDAERAVRELRKAVAATGGRDLALVGLLGQALAADGKDTLAAHHLSLAAAAPSPDEAVLTALVEVLLGRDEADEARLAALRLVEAQPRDLNARCLLARAQLARGEPTAARETLLRALEIDTAVAEPHRLLARAHAAIGDTQIALEHLRVALGRARDEERPALLAEELALVFDLLDTSSVTLSDPPSDDNGDTKSTLDALGETAEALLATRPNNSLALAGVALARHKNASEAMRLVTQSLAAQ